ncbi:hypothetical protein [Confluentibacter sediminis]|uniref:hypothetical protein n=1 Tax=Confluentibacter sediminis TaxID=2219045 RepID=UPI000DAF0EBD|nr:hypothetical protein [Confluentibacter sediminis]
MRGFEAYNKFKTDLKDSRQLYDITYHLYQTETIRLDTELKSGNEVNPTLKTSIGSVEHSPTALYRRLQNLYPYKLRQLILISSITALEVYFTDVILEIFKRDITPFKVNEPVTFQKNYLLSVANIAKIQNDIITKDFRNLTSGGLKEIDKYYKKMFEIDIKNLGINFQEIEEIHIRRHLFVHRNGITDMEYVSKFPHLGYKIEEQIKIEHDYLVNALNKLSEFAGLVNKEILKKYPDINRTPKYHIGTKSFDRDHIKLMIEISILTDSFDVVSYLNTLNVRGQNLSDYIVQITTIDNSCLLFLSGRQADLSRFYKPIIEHESMIINKTIEIKK